MRSHAVPLSKKRLTSVCLRLTRIIVLPSGLMNNSAKRSGHPTSELFIVIPCAPKDESDLVSAQSSFHGVYLQNEKEIVCCDAHDQRLADKKEMISSGNLLLIAYCTVQVATILDWISSVTERCSFDSKHISGLFICVDKRYEAVLFLECLPLPF